MGCCKGFFPNKAVRIKDGALPRIKIRDWIIKEVLESGHLVLAYKDEERNYTLEVQEEDVEVKCCP